MAARYLLDTNVVSDFVRGVPSVQARLRSTLPDEVAVSTITAMEVDYGLALKPARARGLRAVLDPFFEAIEVVPFSLEDARAAAAVRAALRRKGQPIGPYDVLLAGSALARGLVFVTAHTREFSRVSGLLVETWRAA